MTYIRDPRHPFVWESDGVYNGKFMASDCTEHNSAEEAIKHDAAPATPAATPMREANQQRVDAAAQRVRQDLEKHYPADDPFRKDVELLIEIALAPVLEIFAAAQPAATPMAVDPSAGQRSMATARILREHNYFYQIPYGDMKAGFYWCICGWQGPDRCSYWKHLEPAAAPPTAGGASR